MASVWVPAIQRGEIKKFHPANVLIKGLVVLLFINTVGGASLNTVQKKLTIIQEQKNRIEVLKILESQIKDQQKNINTFVGQEQRLNTVLSTRKLNEIKEEIKTLQRNQQSTFSLWVDILFISFVRFAIQLANITSVWLASWLYRNPLGTPLLHSMQTIPIPQKKKTPSKIEKNPRPTLKTVTQTTKEKMVNPPTIQEQKEFTPPRENFQQNSFNKEIKGNIGEEEFFTEEMKDNIGEEESLTKEIYDLLAGVSEGNLNNLANQLNLSFAKIKKLQQNDTIDFSIEKLSRLRDSIQSIKEIESGL